jgi:hypothetical protein
MDGLSFEIAFERERQQFTSGPVSIDDVLASMILQKGDEIDLGLRERLLRGELRAIGPYDDVDGPGDVILIERQ